MIDSIGLGQALANALYLLMLLFTICAVGASLMVKNRLLAVWWVSLMANIFAFLYLMGNSTLIGWITRIFSMTGWPAINLGFLIYLIYRGSKSNNKK